MQSKFARDMMAQKLMSENRDNPFNSRFFQPSDAMAAPTRQGFSNLLSRMEQKDKQGTDVFPALAIGSGFAPSAGISDVLGFAPDPYNKGKTLPSFSENIDRGNYLDAGLQTIGAGSDVMLAASPFAPFLLAPAVGMKLTSQIGKTLRGGFKATDNIKPGQTLYRYEKSEYSSPDTGAIFYSPDKSYAELYNTDGSLLKTSKVPDKFLDIRTNSGQEKAINWINKEIDKLEKAEIPRTSQDIKLAKQFLKQKDAQGISSSLANLNIIYSKQLNTKINPGLAEKKMMGSLDFDAMTIREAGRDGKEDFSIAFRKNPSTKPVDDVKPGDIAKVVPPTDKSDGIFAFHGSGADFDEFSLSKIGTGEGNQAFGYGLYFTDSKDIAKFYKNQLRKRESVKYKEKPIKTMADANFFDELNLAKIQDRIFSGKSFNEAKSSLVNELEQTLENFNKNDPIDLRMFKTEKKALDHAKSLKEKDFKYQSGKTYEVNIKAVMDDLIDYDKSLGQQNDKVKKILKPYYEYYMVAETADFGTLLESAYRHLPQDEFSERLAKEGIKGIKYQSGQLSGITDSKATNFVIFDDKIIDIMAKYGIVGAVSVSALQGARDSAEGDILPPGAT